MRILLANPRGFCSGVKKAIDIVKCALQKYGKPIYVLHQIVHNDHVVKELFDLGARFVETIEKVPKYSTLIFSAHGVSRLIREQAIKKKLRILDATCPLVRKTHMEMIQASQNGKEVIFIGNKKHPEVKGTIGQYIHSHGTVHVIESEKEAWQLRVKKVNDLFFITQTTLSLFKTNRIINILYIRFPKIIGPKISDICYATINRQRALLELSKQSSVILVIGSKHSSNSNRLAEIAKDRGKQAYLINDYRDIEQDWIKTNQTIGIISGASSPEMLVQQVVRYLFSLGAKEVVELTDKRLF